MCSSKRCHGCGDERMEQKKQKPGAGRSDLRHVVGVGAQDGFQAVGLLQQLGHGPRVLPDVLGGVLVVKEFRQVVPETQLHLQTSQGTVKPERKNEQRGDDFNPAEMQQTLCVISQIRRTASSQN